MTVDSVVSLFPETKSQIKDFAEKMIVSVMDGYNDPLKVKVQLAAMKKTIEEIEANEGFKGAVMAEAEKYHKKELENWHNAKIEVRESGIKYDYSTCGMPEYTQICSDIHELSERKKQLETRLKTINAEEEYICPLTGEMVTLTPATKTSTQTVFITINK
jgi:hypothetical protein